MAMTASNGGGGNSDGDAASRMGMLQVNDLQYKLEPDMSVATQRTHTTQFFQNPGYDWSQTAIAVLNSGAYYIDPRRSFLTFNLVLPPLITGAPNNPNFRNWFQALYFGENGSVLNLIDSVVVTTRSGDEISRINDFGHMHHILMPLMFGKEYLSTLGDSMGYGSYVGTDNDVNAVPNPNIPGTTYPRESSEHYRRKFTIPLFLLSPLFNYGRLLPSMLMSGLRIEIKWKEIGGCGVQFLENVPKQLPLGPIGSESSDLTYDLVPLAKSNVVLNGLNYSYGISTTWAAGSDVVYLAGSRTLTFGNIDLLVAVDEGQGRGIRRPFEAGEVVRVREGTTSIDHNFEVLAVVSATVLSVRPLADAHFYRFNQLAVPPTIATVNAGVVTFNNPHGSGGNSILTQIDGNVYTFTSTAATTGNTNAPNVVVNPLPAGDGVHRARVPTFTTATLNSRLSVFRRSLNPVPVAYQRYFSGLDNLARGGEMTLNYNPMTGYRIEDIELSLASTQLSDAVQRTLNEYSAANGLEIVFADYDRTSAPMPAGTAAQMVYLEVRKSASRALSAFARVCATPNEATRPYVDTMASMVGSFWNHYQWQLGSLYFPQQRVAAKDTDLALRADGTLALAYNYTMDAFDRFHPKAAPTAVSLRGSGLDWNVVERHPLPSIREHRPENIFHPRGVAMGKWGSFVNGATTLACTLERSSLFDLSGIPINNSRVLALRAEFVGNQAFPGTLMIFLKYVKVCRVFLLNAEIEQ